MQVITIDTPGLELSDDARVALLDADVITAVDPRSEREFTVFGTPPLESTVSMTRPAAMRVVQVSLDGTSGDLERLIALVRRLKGHGG